MWFLQIVRSFFFTLDSTLFNFIPKVYDLLMTISRTSILTQGQIKQFADRIQIFLGVFMLFRVTFSLITYIIMPDEFSDKGKGFGKLWQNIIISLVLLVLTPYAFNLAYEFQAMVLEDNSLATLVFGDSGDTENYLSTAGEKMAYTIMEPMFSPNTSVGNLFSCSNMIEEGNGVRTFDTDCKQALLDASSTGNSVSAYNSYVNNYVAGAENSNLGLFFRIDIAKQTIPGNKNNGDETFLIDYNAPVSTIVAVVVLLLLITFCMDVALRSIKLAFLQLISPIPIISYIDPKGKDGMFKKWYQMCFSTYLSLFVRLLALYLGVYIIGKVNSMTDVITGASVTNGFVKIFIIIGVLMFAKQLPKILEGVGIKLDGDGKFQLNPFKKLGDEAMFMKKPADLADKAVKGVALAPAHGVQTFGKKTIGGIDAAIRGKGFTQGWNRTHGKLYNDIHKKLDEWAPDTAEARKNERLGREEVSVLKNKWTKGKQSADKLYDYMKSNGVINPKPFDALNGSDQKAYEQVYKNKEFIRSRMEMDKVDAKNKILDRIAEQTMRGISVQDAVKAERAAITALGRMDASLAMSVANLGNPTLSAADATRAFTEERDKTSKQLAGMGKVHESIRKQNAADAAVEDALKHVKYNPVDPTTPTRTTQGTGGANWNR